MSTPAATTPSARETRFELVSTLLLAIAALAAAWSGYQASLWDGMQSSNYTQASARRTESAQKHTEANQNRLADLTVLENYVDAVFEGDDERAEFYRGRARSEFRPAFEAWLALDPLNNPDTPNSPLAMPEYDLASDREAERLAAEADQKFADGEDANTTSDMYVLTTLFFASVLFLAAVSERLEVVRLRISLLAVAALVLVSGFVVTITQRITSG
jgi:hypothetical protein